MKAPASSRDVPLRQNGEFSPAEGRLFFEQDAVLVVMGENAPCTTTGQTIQDQYPDVPGLTQAFPAAALHRRGVVGWVERPGIIAPGDSVRADIPEQVIYPG